MPVCKKCHREVSNVDKRGFCSYCNHRVLNSKVWVCKECGVSFCLLHRLHPGRVKKFCSAKCQSAWLRKNPTLAPKEHKFKNKAMFISALEKVIKSTNRYMPMDELCEELHVCASEFKRHGVSILTVHKKLGIRKPTSVATDILFRSLSCEVPDLELEVTFPDLRSPKGMVLRYDMGSHTQKFLVEMDGQHHYKKSHSWYTEYRHNCDLQKNEYADKIGYTLFRVQFSTSYKIDVAALTMDIVRHLNEASLEDWGNQQPGQVGTPVNGSETYRLTRPVGTRIPETQE